MTPTYNPVRRIDDDANLPKNSAGKKRIRTFHADDNNAVLATLLERMLLSTFSNGGVVVAGTVAQVTNVVNVTARMGITKDAKQIVNLPSGSYDFGGATDGYYLLNIIPTPVTVDRAFVDPETSQSLIHKMIDEVGALAVQYDAGSYPTLDDNAVPCAQVQVTGGAISSFSVSSPAPTPRYGSVGALLAANNLSDLLSTATARANLDVDSKAEVTTKANSAQSAAEATAAAALSGHEADTTSIHGIADTSLLLDTADVGSSVQAYNAFRAAITDAASGRSALGVVADSLLVHLAGAESITGEKTLTARTNLQGFVELGANSITEGNLYAAPKYNPTYGYLGTIGSLKSSGSMFFAYAVQHSPTVANGYNSSVSTLNLKRSSLEFNQGTIKAKAAPAQVVAQGNPITMNDVFEMNGETSTIWVNTPGEYRQGGGIVVTSERHQQLRSYPTVSLPSAAGREAQVIYDSTTKKSMTSDNTAWNNHY